MAHRAGFFDSVSGVIDPPFIGFPFTPKAVIFWTTGFAGFNGTGSMSYCFGIATEDYANCVCIGSDTIVGHLDCGSVWSDPAQFAPIFAGGSGTPSGYNRQTTNYNQCKVEISPDNYGSLWRTYYLALGGDTLQVKADNLDGGGTVSGLAFEPQMIIALSATTVGAADAVLIQGFCDHDLNQRYSQLNLDYFGLESYSAGSDRAAGYSVDSITSDGFTYTTIAGDSSYLALADTNGSFFVGDITWDDGSTTDPNFEPQIVIGQSGVQNEDDVGGTYESAIITSGAAVSGISRQFSILGASKNLDAGGGDSRLWNDSRQDAVVMSTKDDSTRTGRGSISSFDANGFTLDADVPGGTPSPFQYVAMKLSPATQSDPCVFIPQIYRILDV